jgi:hypothetical protein
MELPPIPMQPRGILIAPLNWGLGHATRCVEVIRCMQEAYPEARIHLASDGIAGKWLRGRYPHLPYHELPGYRVQYPENSRLILKLMQSAPRLAGAISREHRWLKHFIRQEQIDLVISDNRYGFWNWRCYSVLITHQLKLLPPNALSQPVISLTNRFIRIFIKRFDQCWVPDFPESPGLAGKLSHPPGELPRNISYVGPMSRFASFSQINPPSEFPGVFCVISGPEPQRSILLSSVIQYLVPLKGTAVVVAGSDDIAAYKDLPAHITLYPDLPDQKMAGYLKFSKRVISRSGYSTIMDLHYTGGNPLFVPTPGQTEQEYLAKLHHQLGKAEWVAQKEFDTRMVSAEVL